MVSLRAHVKPIVVGPGVLQLLPLVTILRRESVADIRRFKDDTLIGHSFDVTGPFNLAVQLHQLRYRSVHIACEPHPCQLRSRIHVRQAPWVRLVCWLNPYLPMAARSVVHQSPIVVHPLKDNGVLCVVQDPHEDRRIAVFRRPPLLHRLCQRHVCMGQLLMGLDLLDQSLHRINISTNHAPHFHSVLDGNERWHCRHIIPLSSRLVPIHINLDKKGLRILLR
mmetsp:Transcript_27612/g.45708  ORF Transcript_27612/g.45708 Transcript_27612/m.45708 type:complete len:223 (+) Transcript_27612:730-1398(+)